MGMRIAFVVFMGLIVSGCAPRGEGKSVDEVLQSHRQKFATAMAAANVSGEARTHLDKVQTELTELVASASSAVPVKSQEIAAELRALVPHSGFTTRPALSELIDQYTVIGAVTDTRTLGSSQVKLLVARTLGLLTSELETTKLAL